MVEDSSSEDASRLEAEQRKREVENSSPSAYSCPDCGGVLWEIEDGEFVRFRCRVGHGFTPDGLLAAQSDELEHALWESLKALEERASLLRRLAQRMQERSGSKAGGASFLQTAEEMDGHSNVLRQLLYESELFAPVEDATVGSDPPEDGPAHV